MSTTQQHHTVVLYHADCPDGYGAAWASWRALGDHATYIPVQYGQPIPYDRIPVGARVFILDFSYDRKTLISLARRSDFVTVIDHHKTAREALEGLTFPGLSITFDMEKSGAVLAWENFHPGKPVPMLLHYIQDRDLWQWKLSHSREISAALTVEPRDFSRWDSLAVLADDWYWRGSVNFVRFIHDGIAILAAQQQHIDSLASRAFFIEIVSGKCDYFVPAVNSSIWQSEIGEALCQRYQDSPFVAVFFQLNLDEQVWSLRSRSSDPDGGFDVSAVAKALGGGGHRNAAGFKVRTKLVCIQ